MRGIVAEWIKSIGKRPVGKCVVCDLDTRTRLRNQETGQLNFVHDQHEPEYIGCKEVWRYWQELPYKVLRSDFEVRAAAGDDMAAEMLREAGEDTFLDERDYYEPGNYRQYIQSREWKIKAYACKQSVGFKCQRCGYGVDASETYKLHAHHLTYKRLFREQRRDIQILCPTCHERETERRKGR